MRDKERLPVLQPGQVGLPGIERPLDNTALSQYMTCPREYYYGMVLHRRGEGLSPSLAYGKAWHVALETHYKSGGDRELTRFMVQASWQEHGVEGDYRTLERCLLDYDRYREKWGADPAREVGRTLGYPEHPMVEISTDAAGEGLIHSYVGKIDRIIEDQGLLFVEDHKTTSRLDSNYYRSFDLSNQMMGYTYLAQKLLPGEKVVGVRINLAHVIKTGTKFERQLFTFTREQIAEWVDNTNQWMLRLSADSQRWASNYDFEHGDGMPQASQQWPLGHFGTNGCDRKYGMCAYHRVCSIAPAFRRRILEEIPVHPWNPLEIED